MIAPRHSFSQIDHGILMIMSHDRLIVPPLNSKVFFSLPSIALKLFALVEQTRCFLQSI
jgi:hypothetical protein